MRRDKAKKISKSAKNMIRYIFLLIPLFSFSQKSIPKGANTIKITEVTFREVANSLLVSCQYKIVG